MLRLGNQGGQEKNLGRAKTTSSSPHSSIFTSVGRISIMVNSTIPKTAKYNVGARVILVVVFLPFYSAGLQVGWYFELAAFSTTSIKCL
jgi:hypothetical protein